jgi:hypothetical protein
MRSIAVKARDRANVTGVARNNEYYSSTTNRKEISAIKNVGKRITGAGER